MQPDRHAVLSPSKAARWLACPPSALLETLFPEKAGKAALEGSKAHAVAEALLGGTPVPADATAEMRKHASAYAGYVNSLLGEALREDRQASLMVEVKLDLSRYAPGVSGTADAIVLANGTLNVVDFKYGEGVRVDAEQNAQMMVYALGALTLYDGLAYDIGKVRMTIYQPRIENISTWEIAAEDLRAWGCEVLIPAARTSLSGEGVLVRGDHCRFCKAKSRCRAWVDGLYELASLRKSYDLIPHAELSKIVKQAPELQKWLTAVVAQATDEAVAGKRFEGLKLVCGRGRRVVSDAGGLIVRLRQEGYKEEELVETTPRSLTELEKLVGKKQFTDLAAPYLDYQPGKPQLVDASDPRPDYDAKAEAESDFAQYLTD